VRARVLRHVPALILLTATVAGCGVPSERSPRPVAVATGRTSPAAGSHTVSAAPGVSVEQLYLVRDAHLVAVRRPGEPTPAIGEQMEHLLSGPTEEERDDGYVSALTGITVTGVAAVQGGKVTVEVGDRSDGVGRSDEVLAYGQIVCTLTSRPDVEAVGFVHGGQPLRVPRADASLADGPFTAADYAELVAPS
jgi:hypothetical protein